MPGIRAPSNYSEEPPRHPSLIVNSKVICLLQLDSSAFSMHVAREKSGHCIDQFHFPRFMEHSRFSICSFFSLWDCASDLLCWFWSDDNRLLCSPVIYGSCDYRTLSREDCACFPKYCASFVTIDAFTKQAVFCLSLYRVDLFIYRLLSAFLVDLME